MAPLRVICQNCGEGRLSWAEASENGDGSYLCEFWERCEIGQGCAMPVSEEDYKEMADDACREGNLEGTNSACVPSPSSNAHAKLEKAKAVNVAALQSGHLVVKRQSLLPKVLSVSDEAAVIKKPFKSPVPGASSSGSKELLRRLSASKRFVPWGSKEPFVPLQGNQEEPPEPEVVENKPECKDLPPGVEPLVLWQPEDDPKRAVPSSKPIIVDPHLTKFLRPHQREGVQFMFECVAGLRDFSNTGEGGQSNFGCILADDMGLGKTLQSITLLWTILQQGFSNIPLAKRAIVVTPTSLVSNWESEIKKWLENRIKVLALCESTRADVMVGITNFVAPRSQFRVLIISYETFRLHAARLQQPGACDLLICDEAHRLKNDKTLTNQALAALSCRRRVLLSGTPMQNDLEEFFAMVNFTNPGVLGDAVAFRRYFENPILTGREPDATDEERTVSAERSNELSEKVNQFILRRTNALLSNHLPPKVVEVVCCKLTDLQIKLYRHFIESKKVKTVIEDTARRTQVLASITALKKLCNHPKLIFDTMKAGSVEAAGFEDCMDLFPQAVFSARSGSWTGGDGFWVQLSGKMNVLARLLDILRKTSNDRIVLVSNYTQTLDLFAQLCRERNYPYIRLDGSTGISKRQKLVQRFNDPMLNELLAGMQDEFAFLLSSKAGGCGLNLIGGNRLVLFDPDWNPANDKQAAARIWRDGQKKRVYIYRFLSTGTIEEKVFQRQMSKEGLQKVVDSEKATETKAQVNLLSSEDLRDLFTLRDTTRSDTHDSLTCKRCPSEGSNLVSEGSLEQLLQAAATVEGVEEKNVGEEGKDETIQDIGKFQEVSGVLKKLSHWQRQIGTPLEEDLQNWGHHCGASSVPDMAMQQAGAEEVSFIFACQVDGKLTPQESSAPTGLNRLGSRVPLSTTIQGKNSNFQKSKPLVRMTGPFAATGNKFSSPYSLPQMGNSLNKRSDIPQGIAGCTPISATYDRNNNSPSVLHNGLQNEETNRQVENDDNWQELGPGKKKRGRPRKSNPSIKPTEAKNEITVAEPPLRDECIPNLNYPPLTSAVSPPLSTVTSVVSYNDKKSTQAANHLSFWASLRVPEGVSSVTELESGKHEPYVSCNETKPTGSRSRKRSKSQQGSLPMTGLTVDESHAEKAPLDTVGKVRRTNLKIKPGRNLSAVNPDELIHLDELESPEEFSAESEESYRCESGEDDEDF